MGYFDDFDGFDEFDEFGKFDRDELNRMFRQRMSDDEFRRKFFGIIGNYQRDFEKMMRLLDNEKRRRDPFGDMLSGFSTPYGYGFGIPKDYFKDIDMTAFNEDGWSSKHWESPDGSTSYTSFSRSFSWPPEEGDVDYFGTSNKEQKLPDGYVIKMLEEKLSRSIKEENYEEAANLRDAIKALKEEDKTKKDNKSKK